MTWLRCHFSGRHPVTLPLVTALTTLEVCDHPNLKNPVAFLKLFTSHPFLKCFPFGHLLACPSAEKGPAVNTHSARTKAFPVISTLPPSVLLSEMVATLELGVLAFLKHFLFYFPPRRTNVDTGRHFFFSFRRIERRTDTTSRTAPSKKKRQKEEIIVWEHFNDSGCAF